MSLPSPTELTGSGSCFVGFPGQGVGGNLADLCTPGLERLWLLSRPPTRGLDQAAWPGAQSLVREAHTVTDLNFGSSRHVSGLLVLWRVSSHLIGCGGFLVPGWPPAHLCVDAILNVFLYSRSLEFLTLPLLQSSQRGL